MEEARSFWCYKCQHMVLVVTSSSPENNNLCCPCCGDGFLEQAGAVESPLTGPGGFPPAPLFDILEAMAAAMRRQGPRPSNLLLDHGSTNEPYRGGIFVLRGGETGPRWFNFGEDVSALGERRGLERLIQQLMEMEGGGNNGTPPASRADVDAMPTITITGEYLSRGGEENSGCAVCKDDFVVGSKVRQMPCKHVYHQDCILPWLALHGSCPVCRYEVGSGAPGNPAAAAGSSGRPSSSSSTSGRTGGFFSWPFRRRR